MFFFSFSPKERELSDADETRHVVVGHGSEAVAAPVQGLRVHPAPSRAAREKRIVQTCIIFIYRPFSLYVNIFLYSNAYLQLGILFYRNLIISLG